MVNRVKFITNRWNFASYELKKYLITSSQQDLQTYELEKSDSLYHFFVALVVVTKGDGVGLKTTP